MGYELSKEAKRFLRGPEAAKYMLGSNQDLFALCDALERNHASLNIDVPKFLNEIYSQKGAKVLKVIKNVTYPITIPSADIPLVIPINILSIENAIYGGYNAVVIAPGTNLNSIDTKFFNSSNFTTLALRYDDFKNKLDELIIGTDKFLQISKVPSSFFGKDTTDEDDKLNFIDTELKEKVNFKTTTGTPLSEYYKDNPNKLVLTLK